MITLMEHQKEQIQEGLKGKNINQSEAGSGKTFVGLGIYQESQYKKLLVVGLAPKVQDFHEDGKEMNINIIPLNKGTKKNKELLKTGNNVAISFESVWRLTELEKWVDKDTMILIDESHKVKSPTSKVSYFLDKLSTKAGFVYSMTATLITNKKYENAWSQLKISKIYKGSFKQFKKDYCIEELESMKVGGQTRYFNKIVGYKNTEQLEDLINNHSVYKKRDVDMALLPEDTFYYVKKPTMYGKLLKNRMLQFPNGDTIEYDNLPKLRHALLQLCSGVLKGIDKPLKSEKLDRVVQILTQHESERVVIFYNYDSELEQLKNTINDRPVSEYNGHKKDLTNFKSNDNGVVLVHFKSGATGINDLVISNVTIYFSIPDSSTTYIQSKARTNRHGQTNKPLYYHLVCDKSVESVVLETVLEGKDFTDTMLEALL